MSVSPPSSLSLLWRGWHRVNEIMNVFFHNKECDTSKLKQLVSVSSKLLLRTNLTFVSYPKQITIRLTWIIHGTRNWILDCLWNMLVFINCVHRQNTTRSGQLSILYVRIIFVARTDLRYVIRWTKRKRRNTFPWKGSHPSHTLLLLSTKSRL
jgi:hypothetical protein